VSYKKWTLAEIETLKSSYKLNMPIVKIAEQLDRTKSSVDRMLSKTETRTRNKNRSRSSAAVDRDKRKEIARRYREANREKAKQYYRDVVKPKNKDRKHILSERARKSRDRDREKSRARERAWYAKNREAICKRSRERSRKPEVRAKLRVREMNRYYADKQFRLIKILRNRLKRFFNGTRKERSTMELLGCTREFLITHLESQFKNGMSWDNYGFGADKWSIDHIKPLSLFELSNVEDLKVAAHYTNLQPMWCLENFSKGNKYVG